MRAVSFLDESSPPIVSVSGNAAAPIDLMKDIAPSGRPAFRRLTIACVLFVVAAFSGGLILARWSAAPAVTTATASVTRSEPELIYLPPPAGSSPTTMDYSLGKLADASATISPRLESQSLAADLPQDLAPASKKQTTASVPSSHDENSARVSLADKPVLQLREITRAGDDATRFAFALRAQSSPQQSSPLVYGFSAVEVAIVPESPTGLIVAALAAVMICVKLVRAQLRRRRTS